MGSAPEARLDTEKTSQLEVRFTRWASAAAYVSGVVVVNVGFSPA